MTSSRSSPLPTHNKMCSKFRYRHLSSQQNRYATMTWLSVNYRFLNSSANGHKLKSDNEINIKAFKLLSLWANVFCRR